MHIDKFIRVLNEHTFWRALQIRVENIQQFKSALWKPVYRTCNICGNKDRHFLLFKSIYNFVSFCLTHITMQKSDWKNHAQKLMKTSQDDMMAVSYCDERVLSMWCDFKHKIVNKPLKSLPFKFVWSSTLLAFRVTKIKTLPTAKPNTIATDLLEQFSTCLAEIIHMYM